MYVAKCVRATAHEDHRLISLLLTYPRFIHPQILRHRNFAHSVQSSRAVSVQRTLKWLDENGPVMPSFTKEQKGMQEGDWLEEYSQSFAAEEWRRACQNAKASVHEMVKLNVHHSVCNRLLEPFLPITHLMTGTLEAWQSFVALRIHNDADVHARYLAKKVDAEIYGYIERHAIYTQSREHVPFSSSEKHDTIGVIASIAKCARVSYINYDKASDHDSDRKFVARLWKSQHFSPFEHVASIQPYGSCMLFKGSLFNTLRNTGQFGYHTIDDLLHNDEAR